MKSIGKKQKGYFGMSRVQFSLGYITVQGGLLCWLVSLIQIGPMTLMIEILLQGYVFSLGSGPVTWACKKQQAISLSSTEAEYRAMVNASQEALWL
jgi:hypothetical protein